jgi:Zn-dependent peptidase ImmA (M78 family)
MSSTFTELSPELVGGWLRAARNSLDLTLQDVSRQIGLSQSTISDMERGKRQVSGIELYRLSKLYDRPVDFFLRDRRSGTSFNLLMRAVEDDAISKKSILKFQDFSNNYRLLKDLLKLPDMPPPPDYSRRKPNPADAEEIAEAERSSLGLNGQPIRDICDLLESKRGIKILHLPEDPDRFFGALAHDEDCGVCFLINSNNPSKRRTFTIAHEYAHCIAHRNQLAHIDYREAFESQNQNERFADAFAAAFLMPQGAVIEFLSQLRAGEKKVIALMIVQLAVYFGVSFEAAGWRLVTMRKLNRDKWNDIRSQRIPSTPIARFLGYDLHENVQPNMLPKQYRFLCYQAYNQKLISFERLAELLNRNFYELKAELGNLER